MWKLSKLFDFDHLTRQLRFKVLENAEISPKSLVTNKIVSLNIPTN